MTEAKEKAEELNALENYLMMYFSHEFRIPLNGILGYAQHCGQRLFSTITLLFDYSKIETGILKIQTRYFDYVDLVKEITFLYSKYFVEKNIDFRLEFESESLPMNSDKSIVRTIVANLISNALKFTEEGKIIITIKTKFIHEKQWVEFAVTDTGISIAEEHIDLIWK